MGVHVSVNLTNSSSTAASISRLLRKIADPILANGLVSYALNTDASFLFHQSSAQVLCTIYVDSVPLTTNPAMFFTFLDLFVSTRNSIAW